MITKDEWREWNKNKVTQKLLYLLQTGREATARELIAARGETGDYYRGAYMAYEDMQTEIIHGENLWDEEEE